MIPEVVARSFKFPQPDSAFDVGMLVDDYTHVSLLAAGTAFHVVVKVSTRFFHQVEYRRPILAVLEKVHDSVALTLLTAVFAAALRMIVEVVAEASTG